MSFMYNPFPYDDPRPVNRPHIPAEVVESVVCGSLNSAKSLAARVESLPYDGAPCSGSVCAHL